MVEIKIIKYFSDKTKNEYLGIEVFRDGKSVGKVFPKNQSDFVMYLDLKPSEIAQLPLGDVKVFKEVK